MAHKFRLSKNKDSNPKSKTDYSLLIMIFFILVAIICIVVSIVISNKKPEVTYVEKIDANKKYVYTIKEETNLTQEETVNKIPKINIGGSEISNINEEILNTYEKVKKNSEYDYTYKYNQSENILSLLIQYIYAPKKAAYPITFYKTYNIDLETGEVLSYDDLLELYNIEKQKLNDFLEAKFEEHYRNLINKKYYTSKQCSYSCFLNNRGISTDYLKGTSLYVENNSLTIFKFYYRSSKYNEEEYFSKIPYQITVKEKR